MCHSTPITIPKMSLGSHGFALVKAGSFAKIKTVHDTSACEVFLAKKKTEEATEAAGAGDSAQNSSSDGEVVIVVRRTKIVGPNSLDSFDLQSELYALCDHPNIVRPMALCMDPPTYAQVLPLAKYGSLYELLHDPARETQRQVLSWPLSFAIAHDIAAAINYLHNDLGLLFRDLKPANVLVFEDFSAKLTDFDTVKFVDESRNRTKTVYHHGPSGGFHKAFIAGTLVYMAPELMMNRPYTPAADVYSLGVTMNELATGCIPYSDVETTTLQFHTVIEANYSQQALMQDITTKHLRPNPATRAPSYAGASSIPAAYTDLSKKCWAGDAGSRPSAAQVLEALDKLAADNGFGDIVANLKVRQQHAEESAKAAASSKPSTAEAQEDTGDGAQLPAAAGDAAAAASAGAPRLTRAEATAKKSKAKVKAWNQFFSQRNDEDLRRRSSKIDWQAFANTAGGGGGGDSTYVPVVRGGGLASFGLRGEDNMEDTFFVFESLDTATSSTGYGSAHIYGVADGHAGPGAAVFVQANFVDTLLSVLEEAQTKGEEMTMPAALRETFLRIDAAFVKWAKDNDDSSGCALVVCVVVGGTVYVANAGDCRAVVSRKT